MNMFLLALLAQAAAPGPDGAQTYTTEQVGIVYQQCLARDAARLSRTPTPEEIISRIVQHNCARTRKQMRTAAADPAEADKMLAAIDADADATFAEKTRRVREMRASMQPQPKK